MLKKTNVLIDTSPLGNAHAHRGIGIYTSLLVQNLEKLKNINLHRSTQKKPADFKADLVHYPYFDLFFSTLPLIHKAKKQIVTIHDVIPLVFPKYYQPGLKGSLRFTKQKFSLSKIDAIITDSLASKADIIKYLNIDADKIHVIYLAANPDLQRPKPKAIHNIKYKYRLPDNYLLYVGDINYNKNIPQLIKALKFLDEKIKLVCVGKNFKAPQPTPDQLALDPDAEAPVIPEWQWIDTQMAMSNVKDRVKFITDLGGDATEDLAAIYSGAIAYIQPSLYEGFGLPVLEAMQCQTPVIASNNSSLIEITDNGKYALLAEPTAEKIAENIKIILSWSKIKRQEKVKSAFKYSQKYSWAKTARETAKIYKQVLNAK